MQNTEQIIREFLKAENARDWDTCALFVHPSIEYTVIGSGESIKGKQTYLDRMKAVYEQLPDWQFEILHLAIEKDTAIVEFVGKGHFTGEEFGQTFVNVPLEVQAVCVFELQDEMIYREREYFDYEGYRKQLQES